MALVDDVELIVQPLLPALGLDLYDIEYTGGNLRVTVDRDGGVTLDQIADATRVIGRALDDADPMPGRFTLEVSSPGVERRLRTPVHFRAAVGEQVNLKLAPHVETERRVRGELAEADDEVAVVVDESGVEHRIALSDVTRANTVFTWESAPKPGSPEARARARSGAAARARASEETDPERRAAAR